MRTRCSTREGKRGAPINSSEGPGRRSRSTALREAASGALIVAHHEDTTLLRRTLEREGLVVEEIRGPYTAEQLEYSRQIRCLVNHANAWRVASTRDGLTIIVEADFDPVEQFGRLPVPFVDVGVKEGRFAWLYAAGAVLYGIDADGRPFGHACTTVAYVLNAPAAKCLLEFFERELQQSEPGRYRPWDTYFGVFLRKERGILNYLPVYQYGEHAGSANREHGLAGIRAWHEADVLAGRLAFEPMYMRGRRSMYWARRFRGRARGFVRLFSLRYFDPRHINERTTKGRGYMAAFSLGRLLGCVRLPRQEDPPR